MRREQNVIATTTSTLEGYEIGNYLGVIASHVVAGTNMFSDIFASLSDIFGGRSRTYQNQLAKINDEAVNLLKEKAAAMGGNCIVGLRIDHDEVSGGGKSMFMVTATGTAAKARRTKTMGQDVQNRISMLSATDLSNLLQRKSLVDAAVGNTLVLNRETWEFLCDHQVYEVADYVTVNVTKAIKEPWAFSDNFLDICKSYFMSLPNDHVKRTLYPIMRSTDDSLRAYALDIISKMHLFDYDEVDNLLRSDRFDEQKYGLALLATEKESYGEEDISRLEKMLHLVENGFGRRSELIDIDRKFSSRTTRKWKCECGAVVSLDHKYCGSCRRDAFGFKDGETSPKYIGKLLAQKIAVLKQAFTHP